MAETVTGKVAGNISSMYSMIRQKTSDIQETFESLTHGTNLITDKQKTLDKMSTLSSNSSEENLSAKTTLMDTKSSMNRNDSTESDSLTENSSATKHGKNASQNFSSASVDGTTTLNKEDELLYLVTNILFTVLWRGIDNNGGDSW